MISSQYQYLKARRNYIDMLTFMRRHNRAKNRKTLSGKSR